MTSAPEFGVPVGEGLLGAERAVIARGGARLARLGAGGDPASMSREQLADTVASLCELSEHIALMAGRYMDLGEQTAASLTKGEKSMVALVSARTHLTRSRAAQLLRAGSVKHRFPSFHQAMLDGRITSGHTDLIVDLAKRVNSKQLADSEKALAALAVLCTPEEFRDKLREWEAAADPTEHLDEFLRAQASRNFSWAKDLFGNIHIAGTLEPLAGEQVVGAIEQRVTQLRATDPELKGVAANHDALVDLILGDAAPNVHVEVIYPDIGEHPGLELELTHDHMPLPDHCEVPDATEFDLLIEEAERNLIEGIKAQIHYIRHASGLHTRIDVSAPTVPAQRDTSFGSIAYPRTAGGTLVPPALVTQHAARVRRHRLDRYNHLIDDPPAGRHFTTNQRRMITLRDVHCKHPGCRTPARQCQYDHIQPWSDRGPTTVCNGQLLCQFHHRFKHRHDPQGSTIFEDSPVQLE